MVSHAGKEKGTGVKSRIAPRTALYLELCYNFQVTPWLNITPDVQFAHPDAGAIAKNALFYSLRANVRL